MSSYFLAAGNRALKIFKDLNFRGDKCIYYRLLFTISFALILETLEGDSTKKRSSDSKMNNGQIKRGGEVEGRGPENLSPSDANTWATLDS